MTCHSTTVKTLLDESNPHALIDAGQRPCLYWDRCMEDLLLLNFAHQATRDGAHANPHMIPLGEITKPILKQLECAATLHEFSSRIFDYITNHAEISDPFDIQGALMSSVAHAAETGSDNGVPKQS